ncbi:MAG: GGDEF domain-containing protein [Hyphomicrobiales bacterium]|nr:GGDEF domain-containing protein [Hyphomicrobiales bacterium]
MTQRNNSHQSTHSTAQSALGRINSHGLPAHPRSYELWYRYAAEENGPLGAAVKSRLEENGQLTAEDIEELFSTYIAPTDSGDKVDRLGGRIAKKIEQVMTMIGAAETPALSYSANLTDASNQLGTARDREAVRTVVESLSLSTKDMETNNLKLHDQLHTMWQEVGKLRRELDTIRKESLTDPLTSLGNRKFFNASLERTIKECRAAREPLTLMMADVDHFKRINDTFGHVVGDRVLRFVASTIKEVVGSSAIAARYGGEEFAVILPRTTLATAIELAERLRIAVMRAELVRQSTGERHARVTISVGAAELGAHASPQPLIEAADACLYAAKHNGRNCVVGEKDERLLTAVGG